MEIAVWPFSRADPPAAHDRKWVVLRTAADQGLVKLTGQAIDRYYQRPIIEARRAAIGQLHQLVSVGASRARDRFASVGLRNHLRNSVDKNILVVEGRQALHAGCHLQHVVLVLVAPHRHLGLL